eukprot:symbB.v1.2.007885.t1/scaffold489.1/size197246/3
MEAEYGCYFLRNYQSAPLSGTTLPREFPFAPIEEAVSEPKVAAARPVAEKPRLNSSQSFGLAKPPPPKFAVGSAEESEVVVIDTLREPVSKVAASAPEEDFATGNVSDDEELLLGDDGGVATGGEKKQKCDGVDSDSDKEVVPPEVVPPPERPALVETPRAPTTTLQLSPSPPGGESPLPVMPTACAGAAIQVSHPCLDGG